MDTPKNKVFGIGLNKTGTSTLKACLRKLGYKHQGHDWDLLRLYVKYKTYNELKTRIEKFDSFEDWPWPLIWKEVFYDYPSSKFILTTRKDIDTWFKSQCKHILRYPETKESNKLVYGFEDPVTAEKHFKDFYCAYNEGVRRFFSKNAPERLLEICWEDGDGWRKLCSYLEEPVPEYPIPHSNNSNVPMEFKYLWMGQRKKAIKLILRKCISMPQTVQYYRDIFYLIRNMSNKRKKRKV